MEDTVPTPVDEAAALAAQGAPQRLVVSELKFVVSPTGGSVGRTESGEVVLGFDAVAQCKIEVVLPDEAKRMIQRGMLGADIASPEDMEAEVRRSGLVVPR